jgi:hypothetical protein
MVYGLGLRIQNLALLYRIYRAQGSEGSGFRVKDSGYRVYGLRCRVHNIGLRVYEVKV